MESPQTIPSEKILERLKKGNEAFLSAQRNDGDISPARRADTCDNGQHPYAIIITCSDSRVVPEDIFMTGIGELFTVRVAGNVIGATQVASTVYAAHHLKAQLAMVLGHTHCGAISAVFEGEDGASVAPLLDPIRQAIGEERDDYKACVLNVRAGMNQLRHNADVSALVDEGALRIVGAVYHIDSGRVEIVDA